MNTSWQHTIRIIFFSVLLGGAAGILTTALTTNYLADYALQLGQITEPLRISEQRPIAFPSSYEEARERLEQDALPAVALLIEESGAEVLSFDDDYTLGVSVTSDGWVMLFGDTGYSQFFANEQLCDLGTFVADEMTGVAFVQCDTHSMPVAGFGSGFDVSAGEQVFVVTGYEAFELTQSVEITHAAEVSTWNSDEPSRRILLSSVAGSDIGDPVFDLSGKFIGFVDEILTDGRVSVLPVEAMLPALDGLLLNGEISRPALRGNVVNLAHAIVDEELSRGRTAGALLYGLRGVGEDSVLSGTGIERETIILSVNYELINADRSLDELLFQYDVGDTVVLVVDREGDEIEIEIELPEWVAYK